MLIRALIIGLFLLISIVLWFPAFQSSEDYTQDDEPELVPEFTAKLLHQEMFDDNGKLMQEVFSQKMEHFSELSLTHFEGPEFILYQADIPQWRLSSKYGDLQDGILTLDESVKVAQLVENHMVKTITTEFLQINLDKNLITTDEKIHIFGDHIEVIGQGLLADLNEGSLTLTQHVRTVLKDKTNEN